MSTMPVTIENSANADEILIAFAEAAKSGTANVSEWSDRHPELSRDFARIATEQFTGEITEATDPAQTARLRQVGRTALAQLRARYVPAPLTSLLDPKRDITPEKIAAYLALPTQYVAKLQRRLFAPESLPQALVQRLAEAIERSYDEVSTYLSAPPTLARAAAYRSDDAPTVGQQEDFQAALRSDDTLSPEIKATYGEE